MEHFIMIKLIMSETPFKLKTAYCRDYDILLRFRKILLWL